MYCHQQLSTLTGELRAEKAATLEWQEQHTCVLWPLLYEVPSSAYVTRTKHMLHVEWLAVTNVYSVGSFPIGLLVLHGM